MTLQEIKKLATPDKKFIRECNKCGCIDVYFSYNMAGILMVNSWKVKSGYNEGMCIYTRPAPPSPYPPANDWIFIN